jgi:hypothetical protein
MTDIVKGLRKAASGGQAEWSYRLHCNNAADQIEALVKALEEIANGGNAVFPQWRSTGPKTREQMALIARAALAAAGLESE